MTAANNYFHCWQSCKKCLEEQNKENLFQGKKTILIFFKFLSEVFFAISDKLPAWLSKLQSTYLCKVLGKNIFFESEHDLKFLRTLRWKKWVFQSKSFFQGSTNKNSRFQRNISMKKDFSFENVFFFCCHFWLFRDFFVFLQMLFSQVCQTTDQRRERKHLRKVTWKICFFKSFLDLRRKNLDFQ